MKNKSIIYSRISIQPTEQWHIWVRVSLLLPAIWSLRGRRERRWREQTEDWMSRRLWHYFTNWVKGNLMVEKFQTWAMWTGARRSVRLIPTISQRNPGVKKPSPTTLPQLCQLSHLLRHPLRHPLHWCQAGIAYYFFIGLYYFGHRASLN